MKPLMVSSGHGSRRLFKAIRCCRAWTQIELLFVLALSALLASIWTSRRVRFREQSYVACDLANFRQILQASLIYTDENDGKMAHPTWGSDLSGPDGWAYLTSSRNHRVPGAVSSTPGSCTSFDVNSRRFTNQLAFWRLGQVTQYLPDVTTTWCPKDAANRSTGALRFLWLSRAQKVTSYLWNASIGGYTGPGAASLGDRTYKVSQFLPTDWLMWEGNESSGFNFNDAACNPEVLAEAPSLRHTGLPDWWKIPATTSTPGPTVVGTFGGGAEVVSVRLFQRYANKTTPFPNPLLNGPGYQK